MRTPAQIRREIEEYSLLLHTRELVANHDGNVSHRSPQSGRFLITPTAVSKRFCTADTIVECEEDGKAVGRGKPPSEVSLHVGAYRARPDANAIIHAHPPYASAFALARRELGPVTMPEVVVSLGDRIPLIPLFLPKDPAVAEAVQGALAYADVALLAGNGVITIGPDLETAYLRLELCEHFAKILTVAGGIGTPAPLSAEEMKKLLTLRQKAGLLREPPGEACSGDACSCQGGDTVRSVVTEEIRRALGGDK